MTYLPVYRCSRPLKMNKMKKKKVAEFAQEHKSPGKRWDSEIYPHLECPVLAELKVAWAEP